MGQTSVLEALGGDLIDRDSFFKKCEKFATDKVSFRAWDEDAMRTFSLRPSSFGNDAKAHMSLVIDAIESAAPKPVDLKQAAYVLGTAYRETHGSMSSATKEKLWCLTDDSCEKQGRKLKEYARVDPATGENYVGRGYVQLTGASNYKKFGKILNLNPDTLLYTNPDLALEPDYASRIMVAGMYRGLFTPHKLSDYFSNGVEDWYWARKIVNPHSPSKAVTAGYAMLFYQCLGGTPRVPVSAKGQLIGPWH
jgi:hypothetical protein